jgi:hypothetical protein
VAPGRRRRVYARLRSCNRAYASGPSAALLTPGEAILSHPNDITSVLVCRPSPLEKRTLTPGVHPRPVRSSLGSDASASSISSRWCAADPTWRTWRDQTSLRIPWTAARRRATGPRPSPARSPSDWSRPLTASGPPTNGASVLPGPGTPTAGHPTTGLPAGGGQTTRPRVIFRPEGNAPGRRPARPLGRRPKPGPRRHPKSYIKGWAYGQPRLEPPRLVLFIAP